MQQTLEVCEPFSTAPCPNKNINYKRSACAWFLPCKRPNCCSFQEGKNKKEGLSELAVSLQGLITLTPVRQLCFSFSRAGDTCSQSGNHLAVLKTDSEIVSWWESTFSQTLITNTTLDLLLLNPGLKLGRTGSKKQGWGEHLLLL